MPFKSRHASVYIEREPADVYAYASDPTHLPEWAAGLAGSIELVDGRWVADLAMGRIVVEFAPPNPFGVLDHWVTDSTGETYYNPMRVVAAGDGSEVTFSVRRLAGESDADLDHDAELVQADLEALKRILES
ncbi:SRPBCC family protein [Gryllotalpicola kribbensis]|jgi:hypothetical protein|uniref:SRPBCC family protein n=1 Tax=Gryllotalpicola kribbensis TaxID=993084 RepID=A0ABP8AK27_9MICO